MRTKGKALLIALCAVMLAAASVLGTLAYLTSTKTVTNTFTVGKVAITLDEALVDDDGQEITGDGADRVAANAYHLLPGGEYDKDPTVTVLEGSERSYVRMRVKINNKAALDTIFAPAGATLIDIFTGYDGDWGIPIESVDGDTRIYEFRYKDTVAAPTGSGNVPLPALFTHIVVPDGITNEQFATLTDLSIIIEAHAIQADGFIDAADAWAHWPTTP